MGISYGDELFSSGQRVRSAGHQTTVMVATLLQIHRTTRSSPTHTHTGREISMKNIGVVELKQKLRRTSPRRRLMRVPRRAVQCRRCQQNKGLLDRPVPNKVSMKRKREGVLARGVRGFIYVRAKDDYSAKLGGSPAWSSGCIRGERM